ncbi:MAG: hypothetical protein ACRETA_02435 [Gammaproteobacteria bacterium]
MHITLDITLLVIWAIVGGLLILFWSKLYERFLPLRYIAGIGLIVLGALALFGVHVPFIN